VALLSTQGILVKILTEKLGEKFSVKLGIDLEGGKSEEVFKWFLASILFGARITEKIAMNTYHEFERRGVLTPDNILRTGWNGLVEILDAGGYVRYDFKTATKLLETMRFLKKEYNGNLNNLHSQASDPRDLEHRIKGLGKGIGNVTANIFLRELRGVWEKADPSPTELVVLASRNLGFTKIAGRGERERLEILSDLKHVWERTKVEVKKFTDFEAALVRLGRDFCRRKKCKNCPVNKYCKAWKQDIAG